MNEEAQRWRGGAGIPGGSWSVWRGCFLEEQVEPGSFLQRPHRSRALTAADIFESVFFIPPVTFCRRGGER
eukprot:9481410-Pyramimonas_sp.AAC.1